MSPSGRDHAHEHRERDADRELPCEVDAVVLVDPAHPLSFSDGSEESVVDKSLRAEHPEESDREREDHAERVPALREERREEHADESGVRECHRAEREVDERVAVVVLPVDRSDCAQTEEYARDDDGDASNAEIVMGGLVGFDRTIEIIDERGAHSVDGAVHARESCSEESCHHQAAHTCRDLRHDVVEEDFVCASRACRVDARELWSLIHNPESESDEEEDCDSGDPEQDAGEDGACAVRGGLACQHALREILICAVGSDAEEGESDDARREREGVREIKSRVEELEFGFAVVPAAE